MLEVGRLELHYSYLNSNDVWQPLCLTSKIASRVVLLRGTTYGS